MLDTSPPLDEVPWPTLGPQVIAWMHANLVHGPGDVRGEPAHLVPFYQLLICRLYEVFPRGHRRAGRRRFKKATIVLPKGTAKTELLAFIALAEAHPEAPVRTIGWDGDVPIGGPVPDPYIPLVATTEEQSDDLGFGAAVAIAEDPGCAAGAMLIATEERIGVVGGGVIRSLAGAPGARDGARTTFQAFDEAHRLISPRHIGAYRTMLENIPKRKRADAWTLVVTTAWEPGEGSVAEADYTDHVAAVAAGVDTDHFFLQWSATPGAYDLTDPEQRMAALEESTPPGIEWRDLDVVHASYEKPMTDRGYWSRVWLNVPDTNERRWVRPEHWDPLAAQLGSGDAGDRITLGFDGARTRDTTALVATRLEDGYTWVEGWWERPPEAENWEVPRAEVEHLLEAVFATYQVVRMYADPPKWESYIANWIGRWGKDRVFEWWTNRGRPVAYANVATEDEIKRGAWMHSGDPRLRSHVLAAEKAWMANITLYEGEEDSAPRTGYKLMKPAAIGGIVPRIDGAVALVLAHEARRDAIAAGALHEEPPPRGRVHTIGADEDLVEEMRRRLEEEVAGYEEREAARRRRMAERK